VRAHAGLHAYGLHPIDDLDISRDQFLFELNWILGSLAHHLHSLQLQVTVHAFSPALIGYNMDPRYPETVFRHKFAYLTELKYIIQGESPNGGDFIHLPYFLNDHPDLKKLKLSLSSSPHCHFNTFALPLDTVITLPQLEILETPLHYLCCKLHVPMVREVQVKYPHDGYGLSPASASALVMEHIWQNGTLSAMLPDLQYITVHRTWEFDNIELVAWISGHFRNLRSLDIQGHFWLVCSSQSGVPSTNQLCRKKITQIFQTYLQHSQGWKKCNMVGPLCGWIAPSMPVK
jgi:hypothetical protein